MKLFKSIDEKFEEIGFKKVKDDRYAVIYERYNEQFKYTHVLDILHKTSGCHIVQSYDKESKDTQVGMTYYEMQLACKKMKQKGWKSK